VSFNEWAFSRVQRGDQKRGKKSGKKTNLQKPSQDGAARYTTRARSSDRGQGWGFRRNQRSYLLVGGRKGGGTQK